MFDLKNSLPSQLLHLQRDWIFSMPDILQRLNIRRKCFYCSFRNSCGIFCLYVWMGLRPIISETWNSSKLCSIPNFQNSLCQLFILFRQQNSTTLECQLCTIVRPYLCYVSIIPLLVIHQRNQVKRYFTLPFVKKIFIC